MTWSWLKRTLQNILHLGDSPRRTALAFAIGVFIAFSPTYGLHILSVVVLAWALRLNVVAMLAGSLINNPWTILPILGSSIWVGLKVLPNPALPVMDWSQFGLQVWWKQLQSYIWPFVLGATLLGLIAAFIAYPLVYFTVQRYRAGQTTPDHSRGRFVTIPGKSQKRISEWEQ